MKYILIKLAVLGLLLPAITFGQTSVKNLVYAASNTALRDLYFIQNSRKIITLKQERTQPLKVYLMSDENLVVDTLKNMYLLAIYPLPNEQLLFEGLHSLSVFTLNDNQISEVRSIPFASTNIMKRTILFHNMVITANHNVTKNKAINSLSVWLTDTSRTTSIDRNNNTISIPFRESMHLNKNLVYTLPITIGIGLQQAGIFLRDTQELCVINKDGQYKIYQLPVSKMQVWSYIYDWSANKHYLVRATDSKLELYMLRNSNLLYIQPIEHYPTQIVSGKMVYCQGSFKSNCDFYAENITPFQDGEDLSIQVIKGLINKQ